MNSIQTDSEGVDFQDEFIHIYRYIYIDNSIQIYIYNYASFSY